MTSSPPSSAGASGDGRVALDERYTIVRTLGRGAMGQVYEGVHTTLGKPVAIKVLHRQLAADARSRKRLLREARAASAIHHPGVVEIIDFGETPKGAVFLVMELLEGRDLSQVIADGPLPWPRALHLLRQAAEALAVAHGQGIVHRDIKPANCYVVKGAEGEMIKLLDFGIAKVDAATDSTTGLTATGEIMGTASYMAPELTFGTPAGVPTDIYALGMMGYELLTGAPPFRGKNPYDVLKRHIEEAPVPPSQLVPGIPVLLEAAVLRAVAKKPEERFASMEDFEAALVAVEAAAEGPVSTGAGALAGPSSMGPTGTEIMTSMRPAGVDEEAATVALLKEAAPASSSAAPRPSTSPPKSMGSSIPMPAHPGPSADPEASSRRVVVAVMISLLVTLLGVGAWLALR